MFVVLAASVVTLHCQAYDISRGAPSGAPKSFTMTVDYDREYAYFRGEPIGDGVGIGGLHVTPGAIIVPRAKIGTLHLYGARVSRENGDVRAVTYDAWREFEDDNNGLKGERTYSGICRPGDLVPIPSTLF